MQAKCPECGWSKKLPDSDKWEGKEAECPECGMIFKITSRASKEDASHRGRNARSSAATSMEKSAADQYLHSLAWINMVVMFIGGMVVLMQAGKIAAIAVGISMIWFGILGTSFLLTVAQIARQLRRDSQKH